MTNRTRTARRDPLRASRFALFLLLLASIGATVAALTLPAFTEATNDTGSAVFPLVAVAAIAGLWSLRPTKKGHAARRRA